MRTRVTSGLRVVWSLGLSLAFLLPLASLSYEPDARTAVKIGLVAFVALSAWRPAEALLALVALLPLTLAIEMLGSGLPSAQLTECLMLAFGAGGALRMGWVEGPPSRLSGPALVFGAAVVASLLVELSVLRSITPARHVADEVWQHLTRDYWKDPRPFASLHSAVRWLAVLGVAAFAERAVRLKPTRAAWVVAVWVAAGGVAAVYAALRLMEVVVSRSASAIETVTWIVRNYRISAFHPDPNAAGSYFALVLVAALIIGLRRRWVWVWVGVLPLVLMAFALAQSRAAIGAVVVVLGVHFLARVRRGRPVLLAVAASAVGVALLVVAMAATRSSHGSIGDALELRREMARVGARMVERYPVFGVGVGDYVRVSRRFMGGMDALQAFAPIGENAHNNFLQILVELGLPAFLVFLWLAWLVSLPAWLRRGAPDPANRDAMAAGLSAFLLSAAFGHPLLIVEVAAAFFLAAGIIASGVAVPVDPRNWRWRLTMAGAAFFLLSLSWRFR